MSADNFIAVFSSKDALGRDLRWYIEECMMPHIENPTNERIWKDSVVSHTPYDKTYHTRQSALIAAHNMARNISILEYGVIELND